MAVIQCGFHIQARVELMSYHILKKLLSTQPSPLLEQIFEAHKS